MARVGQAAFVPGGKSLGPPKTRKRSSTGGDPIRYGYMAIMGGPGTSVTAPGALPRISPPVSCGLRPSLNPRCLPPFPQVPMGCSYFCRTSKSQACLGICCFFVPESCPERRDDGNVKPGERARWVVAERSGWSGWLERSGMKHGMDDSRGDACA